MNDLVRAVNEVLSLLKKCKADPEYVTRYRKIKKFLQSHPRDRAALFELHMISHPKGFLGDFPIYAKRGSGITQREVDDTRDELVKRIDQILLTKHKKALMPPYPKMRFDPDEETA